MQTQHEFRHPTGAATEPHGGALLTASQGKVMAGLMVIGTGLFFTLANAGFASWSSPWWVMYPAIFSLTLLVSGLAALGRGNAQGGTAATNLLLGVVVGAVSVILVVDPTWSFTHGWPFGNRFPFLRWLGWHPVWQWGLVVLGAIMAGTALLRGVPGTALFGLLVMMVGGTFLLNLSWDMVWPLMIVVVGVGLLFPFFAKR